jgi:hypothetical protein
MTNQEMTESFCKRRSTVAVLFVLLTAVSAAAQSSKPVVDVNIDSVLAADTNQGCDKSLSSLRGRLWRLFHFSTYHLVDHEESKTGFGQTLTFKLPGGRILHIEPTGMDGEMIQMEVTLFQGEEPMMTTDLKIMNNGVFMVGGPRYESGTLIISIKPEEIGPPEVTNPAPMPSVAIPAADR